MTLSDDLLKGAEAIAAHLKCQRWEVYYRASKGEIPVTRKGRTIYARKSELDRAFSAAA